jgi:glycosyltransferase involved in cell wall biosynthesis
LHPERKVLVMIPALNEERAIGKVIDEVPWVKLLELGFRTEILVVDGNSVDRTLEIARERGVKTISQEGGKGKGIGVRQAFSLSHPQQVVINALKLKDDVQGAMDAMKSFLDSDYIVMLDGDGTYPPSHIYDMVISLEAGNDVVMGSRIMGKIEPGSMSPLNLLGNLILSTIASLIYLHRISDLCTGLWGFRTSALRLLSLDSLAFELEAEMFAEAVKTGLRINEVPISYLRREGESKLVPIKSGAMILVKLIERRLLTANNRNIETIEQEIRSSSTSFH